MTKWFSYYKDHPTWFDEEFNEYFDNYNYASWLICSFLVTTSELYLIDEISFTIKSNEVVFRMQCADGYNYSAGTAYCCCASELIYEVTERINDPLSYLPESCLDRKEKIISMAKAREEFDKKTPRVHITVYE